MLDLVEQGETVRIMRHGKPVADLVPVRDEQPLRQPSWKQPFDPVQLPPQAVAGGAGSRRGHMVTASCRRPACALATGAMAHHVTEREGGW
jgi:antitoxin (DNA-binding transcriptional repressor) of toxin-antitoxin stability system